MSFVALDDYLFDGIASGLLSVDHGQDPGWQGTWPMNCRLLKEEEASEWRPLGSFVTSRSSALPTLADY